MTNGEVNKAWSAALDRGEKTFVGRPCKKGHGSVRSTRRGRPCVVCAKAQKQKEDANRKGHYNKRFAAKHQRAKARNPIRSLLWSAKYRARGRGLIFTITEDDILVPTICPVLGIPLTPGADWDNRLSAPSLDRVDNSKGYIPGNVQVISLRANMLKGDATLDELEAVVTYMRRELVKT